MASFASRRLAVCSNHLHAVSKLPLVRIAVTTGAVQVRPVIDHRRPRLEFRRLLVAFGAWNRQVAAGQHKTRFLVLGKRERGRLVRFDVVAAIAGIEVRSGGKLSRVPIGMAIRTALELDLEQRVLALRDVALRTLQSRVSALQRVGGQCVLLPGEERRPPPLHVVARRALAAIRTLCELAIVLIFVAIRTLGEWNGLFEIRIGVALPARDRRVLPFQWELCLGMIKVQPY